MDRLIELAGHAGAYGGVLLCLGSGAARLAGYYVVGAFSMEAVFTLGMAAMIFACVAKLHVLTKRTSDR
ncbi:MAG: hypothetical protein PVF57_11175 [Pseudomonadales bacterium]|jgi:hypothetical protein